ncbi:MAG TPA: hypothetical protein VF720_08210 [Candidatus Eisenbacteria bacterium]
MLHALPLTTKNFCTRTANLPSGGCAVYSLGVNNVLLYPPGQFVYALVVNGSQTEGIGGAQFGIDYNGLPQTGLEVWGWTNCGTSELPMAGWPAPGTGNLVSFSVPANCQTGGSTSLGAVATLGYSYCGAYTPDVMRITPHPIRGKAVVANCAAVEDELFDSTDPRCTALGAVGFARPGINPCGNLFQGCFLNCSIEGPGVVTSGQTGIEYDSSVTFGSRSWTIIGNGTFDQPPDGHIGVLVTAGAPGQFTLKLNVSDEHTNLSCERTVTVVDAVPTIPASWGRIKALSLIDR